MLDSVLKYVCSFFKKRSIAEAGVIAVAITLFNVISINYINEWILFILGHKTLLEMPNGVYWTLAYN